MFPSIPAIACGHILCISELEEAQKFCAEGQLALSDTLYESALNAYKKALELDPTNLTIQKNCWLAGGYFSLSLSFIPEQLDKAISCFENAQALDPFDYDIYLGLGAVYFHLQQWDLARANFQIVNDAFGNRHTCAIRYLAEICEKQREFSFALSFFKRLMVLGVEDNLEQRIQALGRVTSNSPLMFFGYAPVDADASETRAAMPSLPF